MSPLIQPESLLSRGAGDEPLLVDCRFDLNDPEHGRKAYAAGHMPGARYAHLEEDLSGTIEPGRTGRHPLPDPERLAERLRQWGVGRQTPVVAYDDSAGAIAARLWWLLRWLGHENVAVVDGGYRAWLAAGGQPSLELPSVARGDFVARVRRELVASTTQVEEMLGQSPGRLLDARGSERFRGEVEPIDPVKGHIPGAISVPFADNLRAGRFRTPAELARRFAPFVGTGPATHVVVYCGSGVTACHNILAADVAGLGMLRLYAGSFSEWIVDSKHRVDTGA